MKFPISLFQFIQFQFFRLTKAEQLRQAYPKDVLRDLKSCSEMLEKEQAKLDSDAERCRKKLSSFKGAMSDPSFRVLVEEYRRVKKDLENKQWGVANFAGMQQNGEH